MTTEKEKAHGKAYTMTKIALELKANNSIIDVMISISRFLARVLFDISWTAYSLIYLPFMSILGLELEGLDAPLFLDLARVVSH